MQVKVGYYEGQKLNSRFCWVCDKIGIERVGFMECQRHPEGLVRWSIQQMTEPKLNTSVMMYGVNIVIDNKSRAHP